MEQNNHMSNMVRQANENVCFLMFHGFLIADSSLTLAPFYIDARTSVENLF